MKMLSAAVMVVLLTAPAYAQAPNINLMPEFQSKSPEEKEAGSDQGESLQGIPEEDPRRQGLCRSLGHRAQHRHPQGRCRARQEEQDRQQQPVTLARNAASRIRRPQGRYIRPVVMCLELRHGLSSARSREPDGRPAQAGRRLSARDLHAAARQGEGEGARLSRPLSQAAYMSSVESWRELPGGDIEFTMRRLASAD